MRDHLNRFFEYPSFPSEDLFEGWSPSVDLWEDNDSLKARVEMPGSKKEDIDVSLEDNNLIVSAEKKCEGENKGQSGLRSECYYGRFYRSISLPYAVDAEKVKAHYRDGVLNLELPKSEEAKRKQIEVKVEG